MSVMEAQRGLLFTLIRLTQIRDNAELAVRNLLKQVAKERGTRLYAKDYLDDGSPIELHIEINEKEGSAIFDFEGTGTEMIGASRLLERNDKS